MVTFFRKTTIRFYDFTVFFGIFTHKISLNFNKYETKRTAIPKFVQNKLHHLAVKNIKQNLFPKINNKVCVKDL